MQVVSTSKSLFELVCAGHKDQVAQAPGLLEGVSAVMGGGHAQSRFYCCAVLGEIAYFCQEHSEMIAGHTGVRAGIVDVMRYVLSLSLSVGI